MHRERIHFICEVDLPCYFWEETQKLGTRCAGCFPVPPRIFQGNRQDQGVPLQTTSRSKGFDWAELLRVRYPVASLASTCFALLQLELARSKCGGMRHCAASRPRHEGISTVLQTLPTDYRAAGKQGTKARATGQIVSLVLGQCGILNWTLQSCLDETCAPSRLVCPTNLSVNVESSKPLLDQLRQF